MLLRFFSLSLFINVTAWACLNTPGTDLAGHNAGSLYGLESHELRRLVDMSNPQSARYSEAEPPATPAKRLEADALNLIYAGNYTSSLPLLQKAEARSPGDYSIAANLGTNYELAGNNAEALRWITEAMRRNPDSHRGTEWVHVLVLKAKLRDAVAGTTGMHPLSLDIPERLDADTPILIDGVTRSAKQVREAIFYQLQERVIFVKPKDPYVADLLFALARLNANLVNIESASGILQLAETYGYSDQSQINALRTDLTHARWKSNFYTFVYWMLGLGVLVRGLIFCYRRKWFFLSHAAYVAHRDQGQPRR
jgi:tetratricopeptide (TPR) repeat protein